jgi:hypothetical protein
MGPDIKQATERVAREQKMVKGRMKYVVQADYENGETLFIAKSEKLPVLSIDEAQIFLSEQAAEKVAKEKNDSICGLAWEVADSAYAYYMGV